MREPTAKESRRRPWVLAHNRKGHWAEYARVISIISDADVTHGALSRLKALVSSRPLVLLAGDNTHLKWMPIVVLRAWLGAGSILLSITTERLVEPGWKNGVRRWLFKTLIRASEQIRVVSIHKLSPRPGYAPYLSDYVNDFQYWDLPYLSPVPEEPPELAGLETEQPFIALIGAFNAKKSKDELLRLAVDFPDAWPFKVLVAGVVEPEDAAILEGHPDVLLVNRYLSEGEIRYVYDSFPVIWAYYSPDTDRPSGVFGRAIQLGRGVLVRRDGHLHCSLPHYEGLIPIDDVSELMTLDPDRLQGDYPPLDLDDKSAFLEIVAKAAGPIPRERRDADVPDF